MMRTQLIWLRERARSSLWVLPAVCTIAVALLAAGLIEWDKQLGAGSRAWPWTFQGDAASAQTVLSTIAGSMITVAGTVYSLTIVVLTLASVQFAPRVLRGFMRDRANQIVLGFFVATFTYCLLILRTVRAGEDAAVPRTAVTGAVVLALLSVVMLIYFIDHIFHSIQVSNILANIARETQRQIGQLYPLGASKRETAPRWGGTPPHDWTVVLATHSGYLQFIDYERLLALAIRAGLVLRQEYHVGDFIMAGTPLLFAAPPGRVAAALAAELNSAFFLGNNPTLQQDVAYGLRQIVDIALKAISPAVNDPTTAVNAIDHLGAILITLATHPMPDLDRRDPAGQIRVIVRERTFRELVRLSLDQLRHYGAGDHIIVMRMLATLGRIAAVTPNPDDRAAVGETVEHIAHSAEHAIGDAYERRVLAERLAEIRQALHAASGS